MLPVYNPEKFANIDLRKYHVRSLKDVLKFIEFTVTRLDEAKHIINKSATRMNTLQAVVNQMQAQQQKINALYGAPTTTEGTKASENKEQAVVQKVEDKTEQLEREALLDDLRQAAAEESLASTLAEAEANGEDPNERLVAEYEKYKAVNGKNRVMYYRDGVLTSAKDIPEDIKAILDKTLNKDGDK